MYNLTSSSEEKQRWIDPPLLKSVLKKLLNDYSEEQLNRKAPREIKSELVRFINRLLKSSKKHELLSEFNFGGSEETEERMEKGVGRSEAQQQQQSNSSRENFDDPEFAGGIEQNEIFPNKSMFAPEEESANTKAFIAPSFSGKTTLMVNELNKLTQEELDEYDKIVLFTESTSSTPLKALSKQVKDKLLIFDRFIPQLVLILKKINNITDNRFKFLLLLDDCLNLKGDVMIKLILTLRNANISTMISVQYSKLLSRAQRQSIHDYYLINLKVEDLEYLMSGFLCDHFRDLFVREGAATQEEVNKWHYKKLAEIGRQRLKDKVLHYDQRRDEITVYHKKK